MNDPATPGAAAARAHTIAGWLLPRPARRLLLAAHIALSCVWLGALVVTLLLLGTQASRTAAERVAVDHVVLLLHDQLVVNASYGFIVTGLLFSLFTPFGATRHWWVALKWAVLAALGVALPMAAAPHVSGLAAWSDALSGEVAGNKAYASHARAVLLTTALQLGVLLGIVLLSVFKPWGVRTLRHPWPRALWLVLSTTIVLALGVNLWVQNVQLEAYRRLPIAAVEVSGVRDGVYEGLDDLTGFTYRVRVSVAGGRIARVDVLATRDSAYAELAALGLARLGGRSRNDVDAISGATTTSQALLRAAANALRQAPRHEIAR